AYDIHLTPLQVFQNDEIAIEAGITKDGLSIENLDVKFVIDKHDIGFTEMIKANEREPAHYVIKYAFQNSGPHEIHVEFSNEGQEIRKTFDISVEGKSSEIENLFLIVAALVIVLSIFYAMHSKKFKKAAIIAAVLLAIVGLSYSIYIVYTSGAAQTGVVVCTSASECYWSAHIHAEVTINICGEESYRFPVEKGPLNEPHTHEEKNLIHFHERLLIDPQTKEILDPTPLTLDAFFDNMEVAFSESEVLDKKNGDLCNNQQGTVKMIVNGMPRAEFGDYIWKDGDKIKIIFDERPVEIVAREEQKATAQLTPELSLPIIVGFALIDAINPCVIGVLLLLITVLLKAKKKRAIIINGGMYTLGVYVTYLIGGITLPSVFNAVRDIQLISQAFYIVIGAFVLIAAFLEIKDYFWYGRGFSLAIPKRFVKHIESGVKGTHSSLVSAFAFGSLVTLIELPCTGAPYLAIITLMSQSGVQFYSALLLLLLYNLIFVAPLIVIIYLAYRGIGYKKMEMWRREHKGRMRLAVGLMLLGISTWIITTVLDWLLLPLIIGTIVVIGIMYVTKKIGDHRHVLRRSNGKGKKTQRKN
ncbi:GAP family protein, partial [candidate division WWE3 bacterium]|nr:GAP family protein [candidate division WWE3 bacterium]